MKEIEKKAIVIAGFPGVGKSYLMNHNSGHYTYADSDSSKFSWDRDENGDIKTNENGEKIRNSRWPMNYISHVNEARHTHDFVFVSTHKEVRETLFDAGIPFMLIVPDDKLKDKFIKRYKERGSTEEFIKLISDNYEKWINDAIDFCDARDIPFMILSNGNEYLDESLADAIYRACWNEDRQAKNAKLSKLTY